MSDVRIEVTISLVLIVALTLIVYLPVCRYGLVDYDDGIYVAEVARVGGGLAGVGWAFTVHFGNWIPLTWLSLMLDGVMYGKWMGGYHLTNLLFHIANVLLVFATFWIATQNPLRSAFVAGLFAVHPLHVESVAWIAERKDVLSLFFGLLSLYSYVRYAQGRQLAQYLLALLFFACSLLAKQTLVTLPFVFLLMDFWPLNRVASSRTVFEKLPFLLVSAAFCVVAVWAQSRDRAILSLAVIPFSSRILNAVSAYGLYLRKTFYPSGLAVFYPHPASDLSRSGVVLAFVSLSSISALAFASARRAPFLLVGWLWFLGTLVPMIGLIQLGEQQMADRYAYFPLLGLYVAMTWLFGSASTYLGAPRWSLRAIASVTLALCAGTAVAQVEYWRDGITLFRHAVEVTRPNAFARSALGGALLAQERIDEAIEQLQTAIQIAPRDGLAHFRLGTALQAQRRFDEAADEYRATLAIDEQYARAHNNLGSIFFDRGQYLDAKREFNCALEIDQDYPRAWVNLAVACRELGEYSESITACRRALQLDHSFVICHRLIGLNLGDLGKLDEAIEQLRRTLRVSPADVEARSQLARLEALKKDRSQPGNR